MFVLCGQVSVMATSYQFNRVSVNTISPCTFTPQHQTTTEQHPTLENQFSCPLHPQSDLFCICGWEVSQNQISGLRHG